MRFHLFLFGKRYFDFPRRRQHQRNIVLSEYLGRSGQVHHANHGLREGIMNGRSGTGPGFDTFDKMFAGMHISRFAGFQSGPDAIGANRLFAPVPAYFQMYALPFFQNMLVANGRR